MSLDIFVAKYISAGKSHENSGAALLDLLKPGWRRDLRDPGHLVTSPVRREVKRALPGLG